MKISSIVFLFLAIICFSAYFTEFEDLTYVVLDFMEKSKSFLYISSYSIDKIEIVEKINKLFKKGIDVRVILEVPNSSLKCSVLKDYEYTLHHAKFMVNDNGMLFGSANFTESGLVTGFNDIVIFDNYSRDFKKLFLNLWNDGRVVSIENFLIVGYDDVESELLKLLMSAKRKIYACVYAFTNQKIFAMLKFKESKGVDVKIITDNWFERYGLFNFPIRNIKIIKDRMLHHKFVIVDDYVFLGSANFTRKGLNENYEICYISKKLTKEYMEVFNFLWRRESGD
ncbi:phospholipase [Thermosipho melanesiensis]|uniref:phospholipase D n=2 Tax=Thermosipho melanesiensis TaxID=46541 RepID=A6LJK5_THEM4|nr:phospholipase D-like domain-containing protein [Thermosipho melanesiensis]ABR30106.1 phospholipase D/Transphosphatidylase [Thermosipho melanesiensis BI429]APT73303.1 phospholipase [Thermosipho melanesiensis]OOC38694.1 phospholipase [Thermosipho melanesiensis]OOC40498.1 phospholipase [Thermosipho melanesiensis]OOC40763.1 phospholipase [Thermosipho melanesiensis]